MTALQDAPANAVRAAWIYMTIEQYADHRQVSRCTVFRWIALGLPSVKQGRTRRIRCDVADDWLDEGNANFARSRRISRKAS
jgi:excisionase family DNA binding protein